MKQMLLFVFIGVSFAAYGQYSDCGCVENGSGKANFSLRKNPTLAPNSEMPLTFCLTYWINDGSYFGDGSYYFLISPVDAKVKQGATIAFTMADGSEVALENDDKYGGASVRFHEKLKNLDDMKPFLNGYVKAISMKTSKGKSSVSLTDSESHMIHSVFNCIRRYADKPSLFGADAAARTAAANPPDLPMDKTIVWQRCLGGSNKDEAQSIAAAPDGGYIVAGSSFSTDGDVTGNHHDASLSEYFKDAWIVKMSGDGNIQWQKNLGGTLDDEFFDIIPSAEGGYLAVGSAHSLDGDARQQRTFDDVKAGKPNGKLWIVKLDDAGNISWQKTFGEGIVDEAHSVIQTNDGGYAIAGQTIPGALSRRSADAWLLKLDAKGNLQWEKKYGGAGYENAESVKQTKDGGYVVAGSTDSKDGDVQGVHGAKGEPDAWVIKVDAKGNIEWQHCFGGSLSDRAKDIVCTPEGGYLFAGYTLSNDGDVTGQHHAGKEDEWVVKLDNKGQLQWQKCYGGSLSDAAHNILSTPQGYLIAGVTRSHDGDVNGNHGTQDGDASYDDAWLVNIDNSGNLLSQKCYGSRGNEAAEKILPTADGGYIFAGTTDFEGGDVKGHHAKKDIWVVKIKP